MKKFIILIMIICSGVSTANAAQMGVFEDERKVPILMYHFLSNNNKNPNKWKISVQEFENDLKYLSEQGYESVFISDLIDYVYDGKPLPEKPVVISFDDGDSSVHRYAMPLLLKYNMKAVLAIIGEPTDKYSQIENQNTEYYPNLTWTQIRELKDSGLVEIQSHSYDLHKGSGVAKKNDESNEQYSNRLSQDLNKFRQRLNEELGIEPTAFVFPFGKYSDSTQDILKENGYLATMTCYETVNTIKMGEPGTLFGMGRFLRPEGTNSQYIINKFE